MYENVLGLVYDARWHHFILVIFCIWTLYILYKVIRYYALHLTISDNFSKTEIRIFPIWIRTDRTLIRSAEPNHLKILNLKLYSSCCCIIIPQMNCNTYACTRFLQRHKKPQTFYECQVYRYIGWIKYFLEKRQLNHKKFW